MVGDSRPLVGYEACKFHVETTEAVEEWFCGGGGAHFFETYYNSSERCLMHYME